MEANPPTFPDKAQLVSEDALLLYANNNYHGGGGVLEDAQQVRNYTGDEEEIA